MSMHETPSCEITEDQLRVIHEVKHEMGYSLEQILPRVVMHPDCFIWQWEHLEEFEVALAAADKLRPADPVTVQQTINEVCTRYGVPPVYLG